MKHKLKSPAVIIRSLHMHEFRRNHRIPREANRCLNCGHEYMGNFCPACGQSRTVRPVSLVNAVKNIPQLIGSADHNIFYTYLELVFRPGHAMRDYLMGHRVRYTNPVQLIVMLTLIYLLLSFVLGDAALKPVLQLPFSLKEWALSSHNSMVEFMVKKLSQLKSHNLLWSAIESLRSWYHGNVALHILIQIPVYAVATMIAYKQQPGKSAKTRVVEREERLGEEDPDEGFEGSADSSAFETLVVIPLRPITQPIAKSIGEFYDKVKARFSMLGEYLAKRFAIRPEAVINIAKQTSEIYENCEDSLKETLQHHTTPRGRIGIRRYNFFEMVLMRSFLASLFLTINLVAIFFGFKFGPMNVLFVVITFIAYKQFYSQHWLYTIVKTIRMYFYFLMIMAALSVAFIIVATLKGAVIAA